MKNQYIQFWKFETLLKNSIPDILEKYELSFESVNSNEIIFKNPYISITISDRYGEFSINISNNKKAKTLNELIFEKHPNYIDIIKKYPENKIFKLSINDFNDYDNYFKYLVKTSFDFLDKNFPNLFIGIL